MVLTEGDGPTRENINFPKALQESLSDGGERDGFGRSIDQGGAVTRFHLANVLGEVGLSHLHPFGGAYEGAVPGEVFKGNQIAFFHNFLIIGYAELILEVRRLV